MELYSTLTLLKVILFLASDPSFSGRLEQYHIRLLKPNKSINGKLSLCEKKIYRNSIVSPMLHMNSVYFIKMVFELLYKVFTFKRLVLNIINAQRA